MNVLRWHKDVPQGHCGISALVRSNWFAFQSTEGQLLMLFKFWEKMCFQLSYRRIIARTDAALYVSPNTQGSSSPWHRLNPSLWSHFLRSPCCSSPHVDRIVCLLFKLSLYCMFGALTDSREVMWAPSWQSRGPAVTQSPSPAAPRSRLLTTAWLQWRLSVLFLDRCVSMWWIGIWLSLGRTYLHLHCETRRRTLCQGNHLHPSHRIY